MPHLPNGAPGRYQAPRWLPGGHTQTLWSALLAPAAVVRYRRERWLTPDDDFIDLDHAEPGPADPRARRAAPRLLVLHGLEGSSASPNCRILMAAAVARGWHGVVANWRGCSGELNRQPRAYHSGDTAELDWIIRRLRPTYAIGVSLGANVLAKWLGEQGHSAPLRAAVAIAPPQDLRAGALRLARGASRLIYCRHFLISLKRKSLAMLDRHPGLFDGERVRKARTLFDFDDAFTAPVHGFAGALDYWQRASSRPFLARIRVPTLVINALNDPFVPAESLARQTEVAAAVTLDYAAQGGHVGFPSAPFPWRAIWLLDRTFAFLASTGHDAAPAEIANG